MSESASLHSAKLVSLARSLSGLGFDATNGGFANPNPSPDNDDPPPPVGYPLNAPATTSLSIPVSCTINSSSCCLFRRLASIWDLGFFSLMAGEKWITSSATNPKKGGPPSIVSPFHPMGACCLRTRPDGKQRERPWSQEDPQET